MPSGANHSRLTSHDLPGRDVLTYNYASGLNRHHQPAVDPCPIGRHAGELRLPGAGTVVTRAHPQPGVDLTYVKLSGESAGDAGDQYTGLDRFGRVVDQRWIGRRQGRD